MLLDDCLIPLGSVIAPGGKTRLDGPAISLQGRKSSGESLRAEVTAEEIAFFPLAKGESAEIELQVHGGLRWDGSRRFRVQGGVCGLVLDGRGRPLAVR